MSEYLQAEVIGEGEYLGDDDDGRDDRSFLNGIETINHSADDKNRDMKKNIIMTGLNEKIVFAILTNEKISSGHKSEEHSSALPPKDAMKKKQRVHACSRSGVKNGGHVVRFVIAAAVAGNRQRGDGCGDPRNISKIGKTRA